MSRPGRLCRRLLPLAAVVVLALAAAAALGSRGSAATPAPGPRQMLLRLHELPPGYLVGDDSGCGGLGIEDAPAELAAFVLKYRPWGCSFEYERLYRLPGRKPYPPLVESMAFVVPTAEAANEGFELAPQLIAYKAGIRRSDEVAPPESIGDATRWFHTNDALVDGRTGRQGSIAAWRFGRVLAFLVAAGKPQVDDDRIALQLARLQHSHVERPMPYLRRQYDDTLVPLDNPHLPVPVYWLGRTFEPGHGLRPARLEHAFAPISRGGGPPWEKLELAYTNYLYLRSWKRAGWKRLRKTSLGRELTGSACARTTRLKLRRGHAVIYASYGANANPVPPPPAVVRSHGEAASRAKRHAYFPARARDCPGKRPNRFMASAYFGRVVVTVNLSICITCAREPGYGTYNSLRGMEAVVRSLRFRARRG